MINSINPKFKCKNVKINHLDLITKFVHFSIFTLTACLDPYDTPLTCNPPPTPAHRRGGRSHIRTTCAAETGIRIRFDNGYYDYLTAKCKFQLHIYIYYVHRVRFDGRIKKK